MRSKPPFSNVEEFPKRKRGRPRRDSVAIFLRVPTAEADRIDEWRKGQAKVLGRPEAVRQLVRKALGKPAAPRRLTSSRQIPLPRK